MNIYTTTDRIKTILTLVFISTLNNCSINNYKQSAYEELKKNILCENYPAAGALLFFNTHVENEIIYVSAFDLQRELSYSPKYMNQNNNQFFKDIMLGKTTLSCEDPFSCFVISNRIKTIYQNNRFDQFLKIVTEYIPDKKDYIINHHFSYDEKLTIVYFLYLNNYYTEYDDYSGDFFSRKKIKRTLINTETKNWEEVNN